MTDWINTDGTHAATIGRCCHCGERIERDDPNLAECEHGVCHAECMIEAGCEAA